MKEDYIVRKSCRLCNSVSLKLIFNIGKSPLANSYIKLKNFNQKKKLKTFPLRLFFCQDCFHIQLLDIVNPKLLFANYLYVTGTSKDTIKHFAKFANEIINKFKFYKKLKILDLASNDGTFLSNFNSNNKIFKLGIDPAKNLMKIAFTNGVKNIVEFFTFKISNNIKKKYGLFDVITANNVFAHVDNLRDFTKGVKNLLNYKGIFIIEVSYLLNVLEKNTFDTIYHEHLSFHSIISLSKFFESLDMQIIDLKKIKVQGGSIRIYVSKKNENIVKKNIINIFMNNELFKFKINNFNTFKKFHKSVDNSRDIFNNLINQLYNTGSTIVGYGAAAKTTTFLNYFKVSYKKIQYIVEDNKLKHNMIMPNGKIKILPVEQIYVDKPSYIVIFAWNFSYSIVKKHKRYLNLGGKFIIPFPKLQIISK